jgi:hypothetical protein
MALMAAASPAGGASAARTQGRSGLSQAGSVSPPPFRDSGYLFALTSHIFVTVLPLVPVFVCGEYSALSFDAWKP